MSILLDFPEPFLVGSRGRRQQHHRHTEPGVRPVYLPPNQSVSTPFLQLDIRINKNLLFPVLPYGKRHTFQIDIFTCVEGVYMETRLLSGRLNRGVHVALEGVCGVRREFRHVRRGNDG
jgi:hypothetical protein